MKILDPVAIIDPRTWADPAGSNVVKNGDVASGLYVAGADAAGAYCLYAGHPHLSISFPSLPTTSSYTEVQVLAPPFCTKAQIGAVAYLNAALGTDETAYVIVENVTAGASGTTSYKIALQPSELSNEAAGETVKKWQLSWGGASDTGTLMDIAEDSNQGIPKQQELRLSVSHSQAVCTGLIIRWTRDTNTLS